MPEWFSASHCAHLRYGNAVMDSEQVFMMSARANYTDLNGQNCTSQLLQCTFSFLFDIGSLVRTLCQHFCLQAQDCAFVYYYGSIASRYTIACLEQEFTPGVRLAQLLFLSLI